MWNPFKKEEVPSLMEERVNTMRAAFEEDPIEPPEYICDKCYGTFQEKGIRTVPTVTLNLVPPVCKDQKSRILVGNEEEHFCIACAPSVGFILKLVDKDGALDKRGFNPDEGWLQDRDLYTHEDMYTVDLEMYTRIHCDNCDGPVEVKGDCCKACTKKQKKGK